MKSNTTLVSLFNAIGSGIVGRVYAKTATFQTHRKVVLQESPLAGFQYHRAPAIWQFLRVGEQLNLRREPGNPHDCYAIAVWFKNEQLGYIPRRENRTIAELLDRGELLETRIVRLLEEENPWRKIRFRVEMIH